MEPEFKRPIGVETSNEELEDLIKNLQRDSYEARLDAEVKWLVSTTMLRGYHYHDVDWVLRQVKVNPQNPAGSIRVKIPETVTRFKREKGRFLSFLREFSSRPVLTGDPDIWRLNRQAQGAIASIWKTTHFPGIYNSWTTHILSEGLAGLMPYWNSSRVSGDGTFGDVDFLVIPAWQLYPFPATATSDEEAEGIIWSRVVGPEWVKRNIPEATGEPKVQVTTPLALTPAPQLASTTATFTGYEVRYVFFKPSERFPQGAQIIMVGDHIYRKTSLNFFIDQQRVIPIRIARSCKYPDSWWSDNWCYNVGILNKEINRSASLMVRRALLKAHPGWLMVPVGSSNLEDYKAEFGGMVPVRMNSLNPDATRPFWLTPPASNPDNDLLLQRLQGYSEDYSSQHGASRGLAQGRVEASTAIEALQQADMMPLEEMVRSMDQAMKEAWAIALDMARTRWSKTRMATIAGPIGGMPTSIQVNPKRIPNLSQIEIITHLDMPMDRRNIMDLLVNLSTAPYKGGAPLLNQQEFRRGLIAAGISIPGVELMSPDEEQAWAENLIMYGDGQTPGKTVAPDPLLENSEAHLETHKRFVASPEVRFASPAVQAMLREHIYYTAQALNPQPMGVPPEDLTIEDEARTWEQQIVNNQAGMPGGPPNPIDMLGGLEV